MCHRLVHIGCLCRHPMSLMLEHSVCVAAPSEGARKWAEWVESRLLVSTNSREWNVIDRYPPRDTVVGIAGWLRDAVNTGNVDGWLFEMFGRDAMLLNRIEGPAGPVYQAASGTHRAHAARIWGLPHVLSRVQVDQLPTPLRPRTPALSQLWDGLRRRGLLHAERVGDCWLSTTAEF
jgi:hypothetical protein